MKTTFAFAAKKSMNEKEATGTKPKATIVLESGATVILNYQFLEKVHLLAI
jgi:hypothetical protein